MSTSARSRSFGALLAFTAGPLLGVSGCEAEEDVLFPTREAQTWSVVWADEFEECVGGSEGGDGGIRQHATSAGAGRGVEGRQQAGQFRGVEDARDLCEAEGVEVIGHEVGNRSVRSPQACMGRSGSEGSLVSGGNAHESTGDTQDDQQEQGCPRKAPFLGWPAVLDFPPANPVQSPYDRNGQKSRNHGAALGCCWAMILNLTDAANQQHENEGCRNGCLHCGS